MSFLGSRGMGPGADQEPEYIKLRDRARDESWRELADEFWKRAADAHRVVHTNDQVQLLKVVLMNQSKIMMAIAKLLEDRGDQ